MSTWIRSEIKAAMYAAVDETVDMVCTMIGVPAEDPIEKQAEALADFAFDSLWVHGGVTADQVAEAMRRLARAGVTLPDEEADQ